MKIKLYSDSETSRKIAMCFVGSVLDDTSTLVGVTVSAGQWFFVNDDPIADYIKTITIDLDTTTFDPFAAMRDGLWVTVDGYTDDGCFYKFGTTIDAICTHTDQWGDDVFTLCCDDMNGERNEFAIGGPMGSEITICAEHYRNTEGVEVIE